MPNYVTNTIKIEGCESDIKDFLKTFSTAHEKTVRKAFDDRLIYKNDNDDYGWLDELTGEFEQRGKDKVDFIPEGFKLDYEPAWTQFPDFNKIVKMPESLNITAGSQGDAGYSIITGESENMFMDLNEILRRLHKQDLNSRIEALELGIKYAKNVEKYGYKTWYDWCNANWGTKWNSSECKKIGIDTFEFTTAWCGVPNLINKMVTDYPNLKITYKYACEETGYNCGMYIFAFGDVEKRIPENGSKEAYDLSFELNPENKEYYELINGSYVYKDNDE